MSRLVAAESPQIPGRRLHNMPPAQSGSRDVHGDRGDVASNCVSLGFVHEAVERRAATYAESRIR